MLNPDDRSLSFITEREKDESRLNIRAPMKHIAVFRAMRGDHFVCYDGECLSLMLLTSTDSYMGRIWILY